MLILTLQHDKPPRKHP